jgi:two-component system, NarL family, sensor histidine kinase UhpB
VPEKERSDLARDLHDEIGPLLFTLDVDLASICQHKDLRSHPVIAAGINAIRDAVGEMQKGVRLILGRVRPATRLDRGRTVLSATRGCGGLELA